MKTNDKIKERAVELGFDLFGVAHAIASPDGGYLKEWLEHGRNSEMRWLERNVEKRIDPRLLHPSTRSVISVGVSYFAGNPPALYWDDPLRGRIARYAWGPDYHDWMYPKLRELTRFIDAEFAVSSPSRCFVDTGPVLERNVAVRAGLGAIGYNASLVSPEFGSYVFLGEILTSVEAARISRAVPAEQGVSRSSLSETCSRCQACLASCPTGALSVPYQCDSRACISYSTIENPGPIPLGLRDAHRNWIFGCDECQSCCPLLECISEADENRYLRYEPSLHSPFLEELLSIDEDTFLERYGDSPVKRCGRAGLLRNAAVALGNSRAPEAVPIAESALCNCDDPLVADHLDWALNKLRLGC